MLTGSEAAIVVTVTATVVRRLFEELWNKGNLSVADELFAPTYAHHDPSTPDVGRGPESEKG